MLKGTLVGEGPLGGIHGMKGKAECRHRHHHDAHCHPHADRWRQLSGRRHARRAVQQDLSVASTERGAFTAAPTGDRTFLLTEFGKPFTPNSFGSWFARRCTEAGLPGRAHGLRKAMAVRLAESEAMPHEVMSFTGHRTLGEVERYAKGVWQAHLADSAMSKLHTSMHFVPPKSRMGHEVEKIRVFNGLQATWRSQGESNPCFRRERATS